MPSTRSQGECLHPPVAELERFLHLRRRILAYQREHNIPDLLAYTPEPVKEENMAAGPQNRPLKFYATPSR